MLSKFCHLFDSPHGTKWLINCNSYWDNHEDFVTDVMNNVIKYAQDMADNYFKDKWPPLQQEKEMMENVSTHLRGGKGKSRVRVSLQIE